jgi:hypothetical protein
MWTARRQGIAEIQGETIALAADGRALSVGDVIAGWRDDAAFRAFFVAELAATSFAGFFWEMPPVTRGSLSGPFECAVIRGDGLARMRADPADFAEQFDEAAGSVAAFRNLGGDALLIAPRRISDADCYCHIAAFLRAAPSTQQHELLELLAHKTREMLDTGRERFWISTSGLGVPWVHVRLDSYPKYYQYRRYAGPNRP